METELKLFAVTPKGSPSSVRAVMIVTPVTNRPSASRKERVSNSISVHLGCICGVAKLKSHISHKLPLWWEAIDLAGYTLRRDSMK